MNASHSFAILCHIQIPFLSLKFFIIDNCKNITFMTGLCSGNHQVQFVVVITCANQDLVLIRL